MAGEENVTTVAAPTTSVPTIDGQRGVATLVLPTTPRRSLNLGPYDTVTRWRPSPALAVAVLIIAVSTALALGGSLLLMSAAGQSAADTLRSGKPLFAMLAAQVAMIAGTLLAVRAKGDNLTLALALKPPAGGFSTYARALGCVLAAVTLYTAATYFVMGHDPKNDLGELVDLFRGPFWPVALLVIGIGAPLSEELLFRGFLQSALVPTRLGYWGATAVTTTIWTALHAGYSVTGLVEVFMIGLVFALFLRLTGSLRVSLVCHGIYNSTIAAILIFAPKDLLGF